MICMENFCPSITSQSEKSPIRKSTMVDVSYRMKRRAEIHRRIRLISYAMCFLGLSGIVLMIINNEIAFAADEENDTIANWLLKLSMSISTFILLILILYYHKLDLTFYSLKNSVNDWRIGLTKKRVFFILLELCICIIHPIPRVLHPKGTSNSIAIESDESVLLSHVDFDVALGIPMFARLYLLCRFLVFHSHIVQDASSQSLGYLNQVSINIFFIMKTYLEEWPVGCLALFCTLFFFIGTWSLRACDYSSPTDHMSIANAMWLFIVTFTTVGYGDITPSTYCGRGIATVIAFTGILSSALVISVLSQKLVLTRWEKYLYNFVINIELAKERRHQAANVVKFAVKAWYLSRKNKSKTFSLTKTHWKLYRAIQIVQDVKVQQRRLIDGCIVLADLAVLQRDGNDQIEKVVQETNNMKITVEKIEEKFSNMNNMMDNIQYKLNLLLNRGHIQQTRMM